LKNLILLLISLALTACANGREFWTYVVEPPVQKTMPREKGTPLPHAQPSSPQVMKVTYSDGSTSTEVNVPIINSGQQVIIDQKGRPAASAVNLVPLAPGASDKTMEEAYIKSGKTVVQKAQPVSIVKTQATVKKLVKQGNYSLALEYLDQLLQKYPQHVESLRAKGSILLKMGEKDAALEAYRKAQEVEPSAQVQKQIESLERGNRGR